MKAEFKGATFEGTPDEVTRAIHLMSENAKMNATVHFRLLPSANQPIAWGGLGMNTIRVGV